MVDGWGKMEGCNPNPHALGYTNVPLPLHSLPFHSTSLHHSTQPHKTIGRSSIGIPIPHSYSHTHISPARVGIVVCGHALNPF